LVDKNKSDISILGIIPARGGSKRLPKKNIKKLIDKPLIAWTIERTNSSKLLTKTIINTDDKEIAEVAQKYGGNVPFLRPKELATDEASSYDVIFHTIDFFEKKGEYFDYIALFEPTSPLRKDDDIDKALSLLIEKSDEADSLISLGEVHLENPLWMKKISNNFVQNYLNKEEMPARSQELERAYFPYGVIYASKISTLRKYRTFYQPKTIPYLVERWQNYEIDDYYDFVCIEAILKERGKKK